MAAAAVEAPPAPAVPDYLSDPDAILKDTNVTWRLGRAPDYSKTRKYWAETKRANHEAGSLPQLVENLVKNWEIEASHKIKLDDWRTVDKTKYSFAINGGEPQPAEYMLAQGTYNAIIAPNEYYSPDYSNFASSHKTFKRMMPAFAWEVLEVYSGPPSVAFRWRHWGVMKNDYVGFNNKGEKITAKANGQTIDIQGVTVAQVDDKLRVTKLETWFDPMDMFRQIAPQGIVNKQIIDPAAPSEQETDTATSTSTDGHDENVPTATTMSAPEPKVELNGDHADAALVDVKSDADSMKDLAEEIRLANSKRERKDADNLGVVSKDANSGNPVTSAADVEEIPVSDDTVSVANIVAQNDSDNATSTSNDLEKDSGAPSHISVEDNIAYGTSTPSSDEKDLNAKSQTSVEANASQDVSTSENNVTTDGQCPFKGQAIAAKPESEEAMATYREMHKLTPLECPFMNVE